MLPDERVNDTEGLARTGRSQHDCPTEGVDDVYPSPVHLPLPIIYHRDVHRVVVGDQHLRLLERLVLEVEAVFADLVVVILGDAVQPLVYQHGAHHRTESVQDAVGRETEPADAEVHPMEHEAQPDKGKPGQHGIDHHRAHDAFFAFVPMQTMQMHTSSTTLQPDTELNTLKRASRSRMNCVTRLSAVTGRFITISIIRKM